MKSKNPNPKGQAAFDLYFSTHFAERWPALRAALSAPTDHCARKNRFVEMEGLESALTPTYFLDRASWIAALNLEVRPGHQVLDLCAAPGGKSLILAEALFIQSEQGEQPLGQLTLNEFSLDRWHRLKRVVEEFIPASVQAAITLTRKDARSYYQQTDRRFDRILLDAPCSSERHYLQDPKWCQKWSLKRSSRLAIDQYAMVASAITLLRPGGVLLYSTCALSPLENDGVIEKLLKRRGHEVQLLAPQSYELAAEITPYGGMMFLPDRATAGPLTIYRIEKLATVPTLIQHNEGSEDEQKGEGGQ